MVTNLIESPWANFSAKFVKFQGLPFGCELRLFKPDGRKVRSDFKVKRKKVNTRTLVKADDNATVSALLEMARECLSTDIRARGLRLCLYSPAGEKINGNTHLQNVRRLTPQDTEADRRRKADRERLIEELANIAKAEISESERLVDDPEHTVCHAYVSALIERYGFGPVKTAIGL